MPHLLREQSEGLDSIRVVPEGSIPGSGRCHDLPENIQNKLWSISTGSPLTPIDLNKYEITPSEFLTYLQVLLEARSWLLANLNNTLQRISGMEGGLRHHAAEIDRLRGENERLAAQLEAEMVNTAIMGGGLRDDNV